jgi:hypothetical protein
MLIAVSLAAGALPANRQTERHIDEGGIPNIQAGHAVRGQAWATELFGRRHNRHLLAAVVIDGTDRRAAA